MNALRLALDTSLRERNDSRAECTRLRGELELAIETEKATALALAAAAEVRADGDVDGRWCTRCCCV